MPADRVPDTPAQISEEELAQHVAELTFGATSTPKRACLLCRGAAATGAFAKWFYVDEDGWPELGDDGRPAYPEADDGAST